MLSRPQIDFNRTPVTLIITAVIVAIEAVSTLDPAMRDAFYLQYRLGILSPIWDGEIWRPFTTTLLHGNLLHALFNVYWMITFGPVFEQRFGSMRTFALVVLLAYVSTLPQFIIDNYNTPVDAQQGSVGLSGVIYGLFGILWMGRRFRPELYQVCSDSTVQLLLVWLGFCIVATRMGFFPVANIAHVAGLLFGVLYGLSIFDERRRWPWLALSAVATLLVLGTLIYCPGHRGYIHHRQAHFSPAPNEIYCFSEDPRSLTLNTRSLTLNSQPSTLNSPMPDKFDPYRESLVMETATVWPEDYDDWEPSERERIETLLHADPAKAANLNYIRTHTGFCRSIVVTPQDIQRLKS